MLPSSNSESSTTGTRHRRSRRRLAAVAAVAGAGVAVPMLIAGTANAASTSTWERVAQCESSGNWAIDTGNGYYGGLQFSASTWDAYGGRNYAATANLASESAQISIAEKVLASQGPGAWPVCGPRAGLSGADANDQAAPAAPPQAAPKQPVTTESRTSTRVAHTTRTSGTERGEYTVEPGDTLSRIAADHQVAGGWHALYQANRGQISNPDLIFPGEHLVF